MVFQMRNAFAQTYGLVSAVIVVLAAIAPGTVAAQKTDEKPEIFQNLAKCQGIAAADARLRCYDETVAALVKAEAEDELVIVDKEQVQEARRGVFGLKLPKIKIFGGGEEIREIETTIASARRGSRGKWRLELADGSRWQQTGSRRLARYPREGFKIRIRAAAMGSYFANIEGQTAIKVRRVN